MVRIGFEVSRGGRHDTQSNFLCTPFNILEPRFLDVRVTRSFGQQELIEAFELLDEELGEMGIRAELFVVGGAAMAIAYDTRRTTPDVDAIFAPSAAVREAAGIVAERLGLAPDWLNDGAKGFAPGNDPAQLSVFEGKSLSVAVASPKYLLAMKLLASRTDRDVDDIRALYHLCGLSTAEEGLNLLTSYYPERIVLPRVQFLLQELFPDGLEKSKDIGRSR